MVSWKPGEHFEKEGVIISTVSWEVQEGKDWKLPIGIGWKNIIGKRWIWWGGEVRGQIVRVDKSALDFQVEPQLLPPPHFPSQESVNGLEEQLLH